MDTTATCARLGCEAEARETTLCGASRVPTCPRHVAEHLERYPEDADRVWPVGLAVGPILPRA